MYSETLSKSAINSDFINFWAFWGDVGTLTQSNQIGLTCEGRDILERQIEGKFHPMMPCNNSLGNVSVDQVSDLVSVAVLVHHRTDYKSQSIVLVNSEDENVLEWVFVYRVVWVLEALWTVLSETINVLRKLHKTNIFGMPPKISL